MTTCKCRSDDGPRRHATTAVTSHTASVAAPRHGSAGETKRPAPSRSPVNPANPAQTSRWRRAKRVPSATPSTASGGSPKWSSSVRMLPGSLLSLVDERRHPEHHTERRSDDDMAIDPSAATVDAPMPSLPCGDEQRADRQHAARHEVGHVGLGAQRAGDDEGQEHQRIPAQHRPRRPAARPARRAAADTGSTAGSAAVARSRGSPRRAGRRRRRRRASRLCAGRSTAPWRSLRDGSPRSPTPAPRTSIRAAGTAGRGGRSSAGLDGCPGSGTHRSCPAGRSADCARRRRRGHGTRSSPDRGPDTTAHRRGRRGRPRAEGRRRQWR